MISSRDLNDLHPAVKRRALAMISACDADGITLLITSTYRDRESQDKLYAQGRGGAVGPVVTNAKGQGMLRGVPDLFLPVPRGNYAGLYIEMKHGDNKPTPEQARFLQESVDCGYQAAVCWSAAEAIAVIQVYYGVSE